MIHYQGKKFTTVSNTANGETSEQTIFYYQQEGNIVFANYAGGKVLKGHLMGTVAADGVINMVYHQINEQGEIMTGKCVATPQILPDGRIQLNEIWQWTSGNLSSGTSITEEIKE